MKGTKFAWPFDHPETVRQLINIKAPLHLYLCIAAVIDFWLSFYCKAAVKWWIDYYQASQR